MLDWLEETRRKKEATRSVKIRKKNLKRPPKTKGWGKMVQHRNLNASPIDAKAARMEDVKNIAEEVVQHRVEDKNE